MQIKHLVIACALIGPVPAAAQTVAPPPSGKTDCTPTQANPDNPNGVDTTGNRPLTEKLAESGGVLCPPPAVDRDIRVPPPSTGSNMPVIPPPGGAPDVSPK